MPEERDPSSQGLASAFRWRPFPPRVGDPAVILETIMQEVEETQRSQAMGLYLEAVASTLEANLKFVQGLRSMMGGGKQRS